MSPEEIEERRQAYIRQQKEAANNPVQRPELDKFQVITARFIDTLYGHLSGNHPATSIDNARAVCELMSGLTEYLKKSDLLPRDISLIYSLKTPPDDEQDIQALLTIEMYQGSRTRSNFAKHADRDAGSTLSFNSGFSIQHLMFNMAHDYETLHCALIRQGLLNHENERLYPIKNSFLINLYGYKNIFHPYYASGQEEPSDETILGSILRIPFRMQLQDDDGECHVPAGAAARIIAEEYGSMMRADKQVAEKIKELGVWPVDTQTNASMKLNRTHTQENTNER